MSSIFEVARRAGVSITTVSHVLSGHRKVAPKTREHVLAVINELQYVPNRTSQGLAQGRTNTIAILLPNPLGHCLVNHYYNELLLTLTDGISARGRSAVVIGVGGAGANIDALREAMSGRTADGLIWIDPPARADDLSKALLGRRVPIVVGGTAPVQHAPKTIEVRNDRRLVARLVLEHLLRLNHQDIGLMAGSRRLMVASAYAQAFRDELRRLAPHATLRIAYVSGSSLHDGRRAMLELLGTDPRPTAVVGISESVTVGALQLAIAESIDVPEQLSVVSLGDSQLTRDFTPRVTAVDVHPAEHAHALLGALMELIDCTPSTYDPVLVPAHLTVRETTSQARNAAGSLGSPMI